MSAQPAGPMITQPLAADDSVRVCYYSSLDEMDGAMQARWTDLADHAAHHNAYLRPEFVIPALRYLIDDAPFLLAVSERRLDSGWQSIGLGVLRIRERSRSVPFTHLETLRTTHTFLGGILLRQSCLDEAVVRFFNDVVDCEHGAWRALRVQEFPLSELLTESHLSVLAAQGIRWLEAGATERAVIRPNQADDWPRTLLSAKTRKNYERKYRKLGALGELQHRLVCDGDVDDQTIESFLTLEHTGFRRDAGTSLLSDPAQAEFFRELVRMARERNGVFFSELCLDGRPIASTCNLRSGDRGFAFKLGWDPQYKSYSPGIQNELALIGCMEPALNDLNHMDSGAMPGSFMEQVWPERQAVVDGVFTCDQVTHWVSASIRKAATIRDRWFRR